MKDYKFCTNCGNKSRLTANVCSNCGTRFRNVVIKSKLELCPQCASVHRADAKFCRVCGYRFGATTPTEPPIEQPRVPGVELPPAAKIPPMPPKQPEPVPQPEPRTATGLILTVDELKRLRKMQTEQIVIYPRSRRKPNQ
jgi:RNA polymerase subunit RPABC4/transcription elongation factor Spt4